MIQFNEEKQNRELGELRKREEENLVKTLSSKYGIPYVDLGPVPINQDALRVIPEADAKKAFIAPFNRIDKKVQIAVRSPQNKETLQAIEKLKEKGFQPITFMASSASIEKAWSRYADLSLSFETSGGALDISSDQIQKFIDESRSLTDIKKMIEETLHMERRYRVSRILEIIVAGALATKASDIHTEPEENDVRLRYRLDGVLVDIVRLDNDTYRLLLSRIKLLSGLKLNLKKW